MSAGSGLPPSGKTPAVPTTRTPLRMPPSSRAKLDPRRPAAADRSAGAPFSTLGSPEVVIGTNPVFGHHAPTDALPLGFNRGIEMSHFSQDARVAPAPPETLAGAGAAAGSSDPAQGLPKTKNPRIGFVPTQADRSGLERESRPLIALKAPTLLSPEQQASLRETHRDELLAHPKANYIITCRDPKNLEAGPRTYYVKDWAETAPAIKEWGDKRKTPLRQTLLLLEGDWPSDLINRAHHHILAIPSNHVEDKIEANRTTLTPMRAPIATAGSNAASAPAPSLNRFAPLPPKNRPPVAPAVTLVTSLDAAGGLDNAEESKGLDNTDIPDAPQYTDIPDAPQLIDDATAMNTQAAGLSEDDLGELTFTRVLTPEQTIEQIVQEAVERERKQAAYELFCSTRTRKTISITSAVLTISAAIAVVVWYFKFRDTCQQGLTATPASPDGLFALTNLLRFMFGPVTAQIPTAVALATTCGALAATQFSESAQVTANFPQIGRLPGLHHAFTEAEITQHGEIVDFNLTTLTGDMTCGNSQDGTIGVSYHDSGKDLDLTTSLSARITGTAAPFSMTLPQSLTLNTTESQQDFTPFSELTLQALHPTYSARPTLVLNTAQPNFSCSNQAEMKATFEQQSANTNPDQRIDFTDRNGIWEATGTPDVLQNLFGQIKFRPNGDTATPGTQTQDTLTLGIIDPCATDPTSVDTHQITVGYTAYETALVINDSACSAQSPVTAGTNYSPFSCLTFTAGSRYGDYQATFSGILSDASRNYPGASTTSSYVSLRGNFSTIQNGARAYEETLNGDAFPSGNTVLYRSGVNITNLHTNQSIATRARPLFATNPAHAYADAGPSTITLIPGQISRAFSTQVTIGNQYDLVQKQITLSTPGLSAPSDINVIPVGNNGFICIQTMPYCQSYFTQAVQFTLPVQPSGEVSRAHLSSEEKGLVSGISTSRGIDISGCNPVVLPTASFQRSSAPTTLYSFNPFDLTGARLVFDAKDTLRTDPRVCYLLQVTNPDLSSYNLTGCVTGPFSVGNAFLNGTDPVVTIPRNATVGSITSVNATVFATFNATGCLGEVIPTSRSQASVQMLTPDVPPSVNLPTGHNLLIAPGQTHVLSNLITVDNGNHEPSQALNLTCVSDCGPDLELFNPLAFSYGGFNGSDSRFSILFFGTPSQVAQALSQTNITAPSTAFDSAFQGCKAECDATYGDSDTTSLTLTRE